MPIRHLVRSSLLVIFLVSLNKVTGFIKLLLMTSLYGTGVEADALASANQLPELLQVMLLGGALGAALVPVYSTFITRQKYEDAQKLARTVLTLTVMIAAVASGLTAFLSPWLVRTMLVPGFPPEQQELTAELMQIFLLAMCLLSVGSVTSALLHARQHFLTPALGGVIIDSSQIFGLYFLTPVWGIHGVAWGSVIGVILLVLAQLPPYIRKGIGILPHLALRVEGLRELLLLMWPRLVTLSVFQAADLVFIRLASRLSDGSISAYFFASLVIVAMPKSLIVQALTTVCFPTLADQYNKGDLERLKRVVSASIRASLALLLPGALGLIALGPPMIALFFERGEFDSQSTTLVYGLVAIMALRLIGESVAELLTIPFYAYHNTKVPMWAAMAWMVSSIALYYVLIEPFGIYGLALGSTISALAFMSIMYLFYRRVIGPLMELEIAHELARVLLASGIMCAVVVATQSWQASGTLSSLVLSILLGGGTYLAIYGWLARHQLLHLMHESGWRIQRANVESPS